MNLTRFSAFALTRAEMKNVVGGCAVTWSSGGSGGSGGGQLKSISCDTMVQVKNSDGSTTYTCYGTSYSSAKEWGSQESANWCCSNCGTASWHKHP